jgi:hypothetical protein
MFDVPLQYGRGWTAAEDEGKARVVVVSKELNDKQFGGTDSVGRSLRIDGNEFRIIGVLDDLAAGAALLRHLQRPLRHHRRPVPAVQHLA